jgi:hypothetical protein
MPTSKRANRRASGSKSALSASTNTHTSARGSKQAPITSNRVNDVLPWPGRPPISHDVPSSGGTTASPRKVTPTGTPL